MSPRTPAEMQSWLRGRDLILVKNLELQQHRGSLTMSRNPFSPFEKH